MHLKLIQHINSSCAALQKRRHLIYIVTLIINRLLHTIFVEKLPLIIIYTVLIQIIYRNAIHLTVTRSLSYNKPSDYGRTKEDSLSFPMYINPSLIETLYTSESLKWRIDVKSSGLLWNKSKKKLRQKWRGETTKKLYKFFSLYIRFQGLVGWLLYYFQLHNVECSNNKISREGGSRYKSLRIYVQSVHIHIIHWIRLRKSFFTK